jgi:EAL domain-containing protein (putative c-di-GMP-specific phosphodiesterase class I)
LPLTRVKLDRSLIDAIDSSARAWAIARAIIELCGSFGLEVTAEGIERVEQLAPLLGFRAICLQGYLLSRPLSAEDVLPTAASMGERMRALLLLAPTERSEPPLTEQIHYELQSA